MGGAKRRGRRRNDAWSLVAGLVLGWALLFLAFGPGVDGATGHPDPAAPAAPGLADDAARGAAVRVETRGCSGLGGGTGVVTAAGIITNRHVVEQAALVRVAGAAATGWALAGDMDAALIDLPVGWAGPSLALADELPPEGAEVVVAGYPAGGALELARGRVLSHSDQEYWGEGSGPLLIVDVEVSPGWSGGPVVDLEGQLVGIVRGTETNTGVTVVEPATELLAWVGSAPAIEPAAAGSARCEPG